MLFSKNDISDDMKLLLEISKRYESVFEIESYSHWDNPYDFYNSNPTGHSTSPSIAKDCSNHLENFKLLGGSGRARWNHEFPKGNIIALLYYFYSTGIKIESRCIRHIEEEITIEEKIPLVEDYEKMVIRRIIDQVEKDSVNEYKKSHLFKIMQMFNNGGKNEK